MPTNVNIYVPNQGELEALKALIRQKPLILGLYKTGIQPDGNTVFSTLTELPTGGGRGYAPLPLTIDLVEDAAAASKWFAYINSQGKAQADYHTGVLSWAFNAADVADGNSYYGVYAYALVLPFTAGSVEIRVGDKIKGSSSGSTAIVTGVCVQSGSWGAGTAAGYLDIMTMSAPFTAEDVTLDGIINATSLGATGSGGSGYAIGDLFRINQNGAAGGIGVVLTLSTTAVATFGIVTPGVGYTVANNKTTTKITGGGDDTFCVDVDSLATTKYATVAVAVKKLMGVWPLAAGVPITTPGQTFTWSQALAMASGI